MQVEEVSAWGSTSTELCPATPGTGTHASAAAAPSRPSLLALLKSIPLELIEEIASDLWSLEDRVALACCCHELWARQDVAASEALWGAVARKWCSRDEHAASLLTWLTRHRCALRVLRLDFEHAAAGPADVAALLASLESSAALGCLALSNCPAVGAAPNAAFCPLPTLSALSRLELEECRLQRLPPALGALPALRELSLRTNGLLGGAGASSWAPLGGLGSTLTALSIRNCKLSALPAALSALWALVSLDCGSNQELGDGGEAALRALCHLSRLERLDLSWCRLRRLPPFLAACTGLRDLAIGTNRLEWEGPKAPWSLLPNFSGLTRLDLSFLGIPALPAELSALGQLQELELGSNRRLGSGSDAGFAPLCCLTALTSLQMVDCGLAALPAALAACCSLARLALGMNWVLGQGGAEEQAVTWAMLRLLPKLRELDLRNCGLRSVPAPLSALTSLRALDLSENFLRGAATLAQLSALDLTSLSLCHCHLEAEDVRRQLPRLTAALEALPEGQLQAGGGLRL